MQLEPAATQPRCCVHTHVRMQAIMICMHAHAILESIDIDVSNNDMPASLAKALQAHRSDFGMCPEDLRHEASLTLQLA